MIASWPSEPELSRPLRQGWQWERGDPRRRTPTDSGPPRTSRRFSRVADPIVHLFDWSRAEVARFERFLKEDIGEGTLQFTLPDWTSDGWALLTDEGTPLLDQEGTPLLVSEHNVVTLGDRMPRKTIRGVRFLVEIEFARLP